MNILNNPELMDRLAAAYALGTLRGGARRRFEALCRQSPTLRAAALVWQERFASMTELQPAVAPGPNVWKRIENLVAAETASARPREGASMLDSLRRSLGWWRGAALAAGVAALAVGVLSFNLNRTLERSEEQLAQLQARPEIQYVAVLADEKSAASILVTFDPKHNVMTLKHLHGLQLGADKSLQLWALPPGRGPQPMGLVEGGAVVRLQTPESRVREVPALAVSLEPKGGAPAGSGPTGPVLFKGALIQAPV
ncbi:MAG TPA: anti-sigma factor [Ramlibacter sp.]|nr:anti-sigma factor [Ramlibacter sp.]